MVQILPWKIVCSYVWRLFNTRDQIESRLSLGDVVVWRI
jgi:hypothetical protein